MSTDFKELVYRGIESEVLDYKAAQSWNQLTRTGRAKLVRHMTAFANTKGGYLVIGVGEDASGYPGLYQGMDDEQAASFDPSMLGAFISRFIEPAIAFDIEKPVIDGKRYVIIKVHPFSRLPHVCTSAVDNELRSGVFYIRTRNASSRPATRAIEMHELIQRALRNQRQQLSKMLRGILYDSQDPENDISGEHREAINSAEQYFVNRRKQPGAALVEFSVAPVRFFKHLAKNDLKEAASFSINELRDPAHLLRSEFNDFRYTNTAIRVLAKNAPRMWQLDRSGCFVFFTYFENFDPSRDREKTEHLARECIAFYAGIAASLQLDDELFEVSIKLPGISVKIRRTAADLEASPQDHSTHLLGKFPEKLS